MKEGKLFKPESGSVAIDARMITNTGIGRYIKELINNFTDTLLSGSGLELTALTSKNNSLPENISRVSARSAPLSFFEQTELPYRLWQRKIELLHSPQFNVPLFSPSRQITTIHDCAFDKVPEEVPSVRAKLYYRFMMNRSIKKSQKLIAVSQQTKDDIINYYDVPSDKIEVIPHGINSDKIKLAAKNTDHEKVLRKYNLNGVSYGLHVGLMRPRKNQLGIVQALSNIKNKLPDGFQFVFVGKKDSRFFNIKKLSEKFAIRNLIRETGFVGDDELSVLYDEASFFLFPSLYEGFGLPVLEAMSVGTPVITSKISPLSDIVENAALLVDPENSQEIASTIIKLISSESIQRKLIKNGYDRVNAFSWSDTATKTKNLYREVLDESSSSE